MPFSTQNVKHKARELGFNLCGVTRAEPSPHLDAYLRWVDAGMHGTMNYMARDDRQARRRDLSVIVPGVQSLVVVGVDYRHAVPESILSDPSRGRVASYAWHVDYHDIITPRLQQFADWLQTETGPDLEQRVYVDTGAILERSHAQSAGLGFIGKNTMLIHPRRGSYFFLGEILTTLTFDIYDQPGRESMCGSCTRCLVACPTAAFPKPYVLDARRCISYLTIEHKGWIDHALRRQMGNWVFGCDVCQDVCPWQRFAPDTSDPRFAPSDIDRAAPPLLDLLALDTATFKARFAGSPIARIKRPRLLRNACIAAANWGDESVVAPLTALLDDDEPLVRGHAAWALWQVAGEAARSALQRLRDREVDPAVQAEIAGCLG